MPRAKTGQVGGNTLSGLGQSSKVDPADLIQKKKKKKKPSQNMTLFSFFLFFFFPLKNPSYRSGEYLMDQCAGLACRLGPSECRIFQPISGRGGRSTNDHIKIE